jgi:6-phosphofructokinase 2
MTHTIVTLTMNPTIDKSVAVGHVAADAKLRCHSVRHDPGGGGINVARAIQRLDGAASAFYLAGGPLGDMLRDLLDAEQVTHRPLAIQSMTRENLTVLEESSDQQFRFGMPGPQVTESEQQRCLAALQELEPPPDYIVASGSLPEGVHPDFYAEVATIAAEVGARFVLDTSGDALQLSVEKAPSGSVFLLKPNMRELRQLTQRDIPDEVEQESAAKSLVEAGQSQVVVVSLGAAGALLVTERQCERLRAPSVPIQSKIGAGDSMVGGIVWSLAEGRSIEEATRYGIAAGAAAVMTPGTELCRLEDTQRLYDKISVQQPD